MDSWLLWNQNSYKQTKRKGVLKKKKRQNKKNEKGEKELIFWISDYLPIHMQSVTRITTNINYYSY